MTRCLTIEGPLGPMLLAATDAGLCGAYFVGQRYLPVQTDGWEEAPGDLVLARTATQLAEYFAGRRRTFDVPLDLHGTPFQRRVWAALLGVRFGDTSTYGALARQLGSPAASRAVGTAVGRNPVSVIVPCHRIVGQDGSLTGYAGGLDRKRALLALEGATGSLLTA